MGDLEKKLIMAEKAKIKMIVTDGVFSMDGQVCPLPDIRLLADKYGAVVLVDDCHGVGVIGATGRGTEEYYNMQGAADIITSNLSKALGGSSAGFVAGSSNLVNLLRRVSRTFVFTTAISPATAACSDKILEILQREPEILRRLRENTRMFREGMKKAGYEVKGVDHKMQSGRRIAGQGVDHKAVRLLMMFDCWGTARSDGTTAERDLVGGYTGYDCANAGEHGASEQAVGKPLGR